MTLKELRFYIQAKDKDIDRQLALTHWGAAYWLTNSLKGIRAQLRGPEVKGIWIVNVMFFESPELVSPGKSIGGGWEQLLSVVQCKIRCDPSELIKQKPIDNVMKMVSQASQEMKKAPLPQIRAIGTLLSSMDLEQERPEMLKWMQYNYDKYASRQ